VSLSRRDFFRSAGVSGIGVLALPLIAGRGREALLEAAAAPAGPAAGAPAAVPKSATIRLDSNENPHGPAPEAFDAIRSAFADANRYPEYSSSDLVEAIARRHGVAAENVVAGCGSTEILGAAVRAFVAPDRRLVTASPTFELPAMFAATMGAPVEPVRVTEALQLDLEAMASKAAGAGLVYICNPNNPTASIRPASQIQETIARVMKESAGTTILVDEAYFDFVEDPSYATAIPIALDNPRVVVARTFSKVFGLAGLRVGYAVAHPDTIGSLRKHVLFASVNGLGAAAAIASVPLRDHVLTQRRLNREARDFTRSFFETAGYRTFPSEANFMMVDVHRDARAFRDACRALGVSIGRPFPPLTSHARISIGTLEEMRRACAIFERALAPVSG
jgi:histidinol-phosphate aminotransferase